MPTPEHTQWATQDKNQFPAMIGHAGTAGTADLRRVVVGDAGDVHVTDVTANALVPSPYNNVIINYTDSTKGTISSVVFKLGTATVSTLTPTFAGTVDTWVKT